MPVIRTEWNRTHIASVLTTLFFAQNRIHYRHHIHVAPQMSRFVEGFWIIFATGSTQMGEVNAIAKGFNHLHQIVIFTHAVRARAHGETVMNAINRLFQPLHVFNSGNNAWQTENRARWIVRMNGQA